MGPAKNSVWSVHKFGGTSVAVQGREAEGEERDRLWRTMAEGYKGYDNYKLKTSREIPVFVLAPAS